LQGWTTEDALLEGQRTNIEHLVNMVTDDNAIFLVFFGQIETNLIGCVYLKHKAALKSAYLGMLAVRPDLQARGYGKFIMSTAETYAVNN
jgi:N-acetylglutamate synthase-like GNAT family acetyltransferase